MLENWLPLGLTMGEIEVVTAAERCDDMLYSKNLSSKLVTVINIMMYKYENNICMLYKNLSYILSDALISDRHTTSGIHKNII